MRPKNIKIDMTLTPTECKQLLAIIKQMIEITRKSYINVEGTPEEMRVIEDLNFQASLNCGTLLYLHERINYRLSTHKEK